MGKMVKNNTSENMVVKSVLLGDEKALRQFWREHSPKIHAFIRKRIQSAEDAEEILQDTFLAVLESLRDFDFRCQLSTFLCSIAQHKIIDHYRKKKVKQILLSRLSADWVPLVSQFLGPEEEFDTKEVEYRIRLVFARLRPLHRKILTMKYIEGQSVAEIAKQLAVTLKSAESTLFRARMAFVEIYQVV